MAWQEEGKKEKEKEARRRERKEAERAAKIKEDDALTRAAAAQAWSMHTDPEGRKYYHNPITSVTTWDMPDELRARSRSDELKERRADEAAAKSDTVKRLLAAGARTAIRNKAGQTALDVARKKGHISVIALLEAAEKAAQLFKNATYVALATGMAGTLIYLYRMPAAK